MSALKLTVLIQYLSDKEIAEMELFLQTKLHTKRHNALLLSIFKEVCMAKQEQIDWEAIWQATRPDKPFKEKAMRNLRSELVKQIEAFLAWKQWTQQARSKEQYLTQAMVDRQLPRKNFEQAWKNWGKAMHSASPDTKAAYGEWFQFYRTYIFHRDLPKLDPNDDTLSKTIYFLEQHFLLTLFKHYAESLLVNRVIERDSIGDLLAPIMQMVDQSKLVRLEPGVELFVRLVQLYEAGEPQASVFEMTHSIFIKCYADLKREDAALALKLLIYHAGYHASRGQPSFLLKLFQLFKRGIDSELLLEGGKIAPNRYINIVITGARVKEFAWVKFFLETFKDRLNAADTASIAAIAEAFLLYHEGVHHHNPDTLREVSLKLMRVAGVQEVLRIRCYSLEIRTMFEVYLMDWKEEEFNRLERLIKNFRSFLSRQKTLRDDNRKAYDNFSIFVHKLIQAIEMEEDKDTFLQQLMEQIEATNSIMLKDWLLDKAAKLKRSAAS